MSSRARQRLHGFTGIGLILLQLLCTVDVTVVPVYGIGSHTWRYDVGWPCVKEPLFRQTWRCATSIAFLPGATHQNHQSQRTCRTETIEAPIGASRAQTLRVHGYMDKGGPSHPGNPSSNIWKGNHKGQNKPFAGYNTAGYYKPIEKNYRGTFPKPYGNATPVYQNYQYHGALYPGTTQSSYGHATYMSGSHVSYGGHAVGYGFVNGAGAVNGQWPASVTVPSGQPASQGWLNGQQDIYSMNHISTEKTVQRRYHFGSNYRRPPESKRGGVYGSEVLRKNRRINRDDDSLDKDVLTSKEYFSSFRPYGDITWFNDHTPDEEWPGASKLKQGETYDGIIRHWLTPLHAIFLPIEKMTECCLVIDDIPLEYTIPNVRNNFKVDHVLHAKLKWPQEFDAKGRPIVVISFDRQYSPLVYEEGDLTWGTPLLIKGNIAIMRLERGDHMGLMYLAELGMQLVNSDTYKFSQFLEKGERIQLQIARMPSYPKVNSYLVRVPWDSPKRLEWAQKFPEIKEAIAPCVYGSYVSASDLLRSSPISQYETYQPQYKMESPESPSIPYNRTVESLLPTPDEPQTISEFTKKIGGKVKDILRLLFLQTKTPIDPEANLTVNLAKTIFNFVSGRDEFLDIDTYAVEEELAMLKERGFVKGLERPPIVVLMGHINHGKTALYDMLTETSNIDSEPGNITQTVRAHMLTGDCPMTLIDTPGHEVFDAMRGCGARIADMAIIVIDSTEGLKKQTRESIKLCKKMNIPFIIAATKYDLPNAQQGAEELALQLNEEGVVIEGLGGETQFLQVSVKEDIENSKNAILSSIMLQAAVSDERAVIETPETTGRGFVLESGKGNRSSPYCLTILKQGKMDKSGYFVSGKSSVKIKNIKTTSGKRIVSAKPSQPVIIDGFEEDILPNPGDEFVVYGDEEHAQSITEYKTQLDLQNTAEREMRRGIYAGMDVLEEKAQEDGTLKKIPAVIKASTQGSLEALQQAISKVLVNGMMTTAMFDIVDASTGPVCKSDVLAAKDVNAVIIGLGSTAKSDAKTEAKRHNVTLLNSEVIYDLLEMSTDALKERLDDKLLTDQYGTARVLKVFDAVKKSKAAGCLVTKGRIPKGSAVRVLRKGKPVYSGTLVSLRHTTDAVEQAVETQSCGMIFKGWNDVQVDDIVESYAL